MNNRNEKLSNKEKLFYLNACVLPKLPPKIHLSKLVCLAIPGILQGIGVSFVSHILFAIIGVLLMGKKYLMWINYLYCCTVHFEDSLNIIHQQMHPWCICWCIIYSKYLMGSFTKIGWPMSVI